MSNKIVTIWVCFFFLMLAFGVVPATADRDDAPGTDTTVTAGHDHSGGHDHDDASAATGQNGAGGFSLRRLTYWLGKLHPAVVHFPIALLTAAFLAELMAMFGGSRRYAAAGRYCLVLGALSAVLAGALGWFWEGFKWTDGDWVLMTRHRWAGTATAVLSIVLLILCPLGARPDAKISKRLYRVTLVVTVALVALAGFLGGALVWGPDHMAW